MSDEKNQYDQPIAGHDYDGIQEFDNPLPMWWLWTFFGTIIFAFIYYIHYEINNGPTLDDELAADMAAIQKQQELAPKAEIKKEDLLAVLNDNNLIASGKTSYQEKCASCHGDQGQGLVGPNLTDKHWIHDKGEALAMIKIIQKGVLEKGMPPWEGILTDEQIKAVYAFIYSLRGTNPAGAKAAEGEEVADYY